MKTKLTEEVFKMRFIDIYGQYTKRKLTCEEAAEILGISISTFYRKRQIYQEDGSNCVFDRRVGRASPHRLRGQVLCISFPTSYAINFPINYHRLKAMVCENA